LARPAAIEGGLDLRGRQRHACRTAVDYCSIVGPWLSPNVVRRKSSPKVFISARGCSRDGKAATTPFTPSEVEGQFRGDPFRDLTPMRPTRGQGGIRGVEDSRPSTSLRVNGGGRDETLVNPVRRADSFRCRPLRSLAPAPGRRTLRAEPHRTPTDRPDSPRHAMPSFSVADHSDAEAVEPQPLGRIELRWPGSRRSIPPACGCAAPLFGRTASAR